MKSKKGKKPAVTVKIGTVDDFFNNAKNIMCALDKKEPIEPSHTLVFVEPLELADFLDDTKHKREQVLDELAQISQDLKMGYE